MIIFHLSESKDVVISCREWASSFLAISSNPNIIEQKYYKTQYHW